MGLLTKTLNLKITFKNKKIQLIERAVSFYSTHDDKLIVHFLISPSAPVQEKVLLWKNIFSVEVKENKEN